MKTLPRLTVAQTDIVAARLLDHAGATGVLDDPPGPATWEGFHQLRARLYETFDVPDSSLTPLASRVLYGLAAARRPGRSVVLGCYVGNLMAFVTGPACGPFAEGTAVAQGIDTDAAAVGLARRNFARAAYTGVSVICGDGFDTAEHAGDEPVDLLLVDIDVPGARKSGYARIVEAWLPYLAADALIVAHDVAHPKFSWDLRYYRDFLLESGAAASVGLPTDECGLEVTRWGRGMRRP
jgi:predicted O-methyltransferase YrrM